MAEKVVLALIDVVALWALWTKVVPFVILSLCHANCPATGQKVKVSRG